VGENSAVNPEFDRVAIEVVDDSWLHLAFQYTEHGYNAIKVTLTDTLMLGQEVPVHTSYVIGNVAGGVAEAVFEYHLSKGRHYAMNIYYLGEAPRDEEGKSTCSFYDLSMSISRETQIVLSTQCPKKDDIQTVHEGLPKTIGDSDLDRDGSYSFEKILKINDFSNGNERNKKALVLAHTISLELTDNFDISSSIEFEMDQAMYSMQLNELYSDDGGATPR